MGTQWAGPPETRRAREADRLTGTFDAVLDRALAKAQDDRQQSAGQLVREARAALAG